MLHDGVQAREDFAQRSGVLDVDVCLNPLHVLHPLNPSHKLVDDNHGVGAQLAQRRLVDQALQLARLLLFKVLGKGYNINVA